MNKSIFIGFAISTFVVGSVPSLAQSDPQTVEQTTQTTTVTYRNSITNLNRAKNLARQAAEQANGGLQRYQAEPLMHGPVELTRFVENNDGTVTFTFYGGAPGARPTIESVVTVALNGWKTHIDYNGPIRQR